MDMVEIDKYLYRYDTRISGSVDEDGYLWGRHLTLYLSKFKILKRTPCGAWIDFGYHEKKFVNLKATKQYACETPEKALKSFIFRKKRQIKILSTQLNDASTALRIAEQATSETIGKHLGELDSFMNCLQGPIT